MSACPAARPRAPLRARREDPRGRRAERGVTWISFLLLLIVVGGGYLGWVWAPIYFEHYEIKQVVRDYMNQAIKQRDDGALVSRMLDRIARLHTVVSEDEAGRRVEQTVVVIDPRDVVWERDTTAEPAVLRVSFVYEREIEYPWIRRRTIKAFAVDLENDLSVPVWGAER